MALTSLEKVKLAVQALDSKKAEEIKVIEVSNVTILADYFVIANGTSTTQVKALMDEVDFKLSQAGEQFLRIEKDTSANWIILDYGDVVVHVFYAETRDYYQLERLWADGKEVPATQFIDAAQ